MVKVVVNIKVKVNINVKVKVNAKANVVVTVKVEAEVKGLGTEGRKERRYEGRKDDERKRGCGLERVQSTSVYVRTGTQ